MLAAVVVTYSAASAVLDRCLASVRPEVDLVVVVDTGARGLGPAGVEVLSVPNDGFGAAANAGCRRCLDAGATAVVVFNDDIEAIAGWSAALVGQLTDPTVGAVQPVLVERHDDAQWIASLGVRIGPDGAGVDLGDGVPDRADARGADRDIELFTGGAVLLTAAFLEATGGFDPTWFLYYEDVDLARRGAALGYRYRLAVDATVVHERGTSTSAQPGRTRYLQERNRVWASARHGDAATLGRAVWLSVRRLRREPVRVHARAFVAGIGGVPRQLVRRWAHRNRTGSIEGSSVRRPFGRG